MTKQKSTKRALLLSALSLLMCVSMLIGSTFAWFTDSVTSGNNRIVAGNLDIELEYYNGSDWKTVNNATDLFTGNLWEPGHTEVVYLKLSNLGSLALKYQLGIKINSEIEGTNVAGETFKLSDYIMMGVVEGKQPSYADRAEAVAAVASNSGIIGNGYTKSGNMEKDADALYLAVVVYMPESVGNEANYKTGTAAPEINLGINLIATQNTVESDSFDNQYDKMATVDTEEELLEALAADYDLITLGANIELTDGIAIPAEKTVAIDLAGFTISYTSNVDDADLMVNNGDLTIADSIGTGKIVYTYTGVANARSVSTIVNLPGAVLTVEGGAIVNASAFLSDSYSYAIDSLTNGGAGDVELNIVGGTVKSEYMAIRQFVNGEVCKNILNMSGGVVDGGKRGINVQLKNNYAYTTITGGVVKGEDYSLCAITPSENISVTGGTFEGTVWYSGTVGIIAGGTFDTDPSDYVADGYKAVLTGNKYEVVKYATVASTVAELEKALANGENVVLAGDIELTKKLTVKKDAVIDLNGYTLDAKVSSNYLFESSSDTDPSMIITSSKNGAVINAGDKAVLLGYGSTEIYNVTINVGTTSSAVGNPFNVRGNLTIGEGTVINVEKLNNSLISNHEKVNIVIDGAKINVDTFKVNGGAMISLVNGTTIAIDDTEVNVGLDATYTSYFISKANNATIGENCTINVKDAAGTAYGITYKADANVGDKYAWEKQ